MSLRMEKEHGQAIPNFLNSEAFINARLKELNSLANMIGKSRKVTTVFQRLPKHMRRRAMSHTVKRVPRNFRESHKRQLEKNGALKKKQKARKSHRKRRKQLSSEYIKRQKNYSWLETHIWHAKRFRMSTKWNYKVADKSYEKTFKASYRATTTHCLIQDISYYCCIEIRGSVDNLTNPFSLITNPACGLSIKAKCWLSGNREGHITIFHANTYPLNVIGNVSFMWKPQNDDSAFRTLWLWCHPSIHSEIVQEFIEVFSLIPLVDVNVKMQDMDENSTTKNEENCNDVENTSDFECSTYINSNNDVTMILLRNSLNRFRLTGPLSNSVLTKALHTAEKYSKILKSSEENWWLEFRNQTPEDDTLMLLEKHPLPYLFPPNLILGCNIIDPRLFIKRPRSKAVLPIENCEYFLSVSSTSSINALWEAEIRKKVSSEKLPSAQLNSLRSKALIPGFDEQLIETVDNVIPILIIQRPGSFNNTIKSNYGCGWDLILPSNWAMPIWLSLLLSGAKAGGLRETQTINFESDKMPDMVPDSQVGKTYYSNLKEFHENLFFRKPPSKRINYIKFGIPTPFYCDWQLLVKEWSLIKSTGSYFVLRDKNLLVKMREYLRIYKPGVGSCEFVSLPSNSLIPVVVTPMSKGKLEPFTHICVPLKSDLEERLKNKHFLGPCERLHADIFKQQRKLLKMEHSKELKRLRRKRLKLKRESRQTKPPLKIKKPSRVKDQNYIDQIRHLYIPSEVSKLRKHCSREVCGFIVVGGFSFLRSCSKGHGYIVAESLTSVIKLSEETKSDIVMLTRSSNSLNYQFCKIDITMY